MRIAYLLTILTMLIGGATLRATLTTAPFRQEHVEVKEHLAHIDAMVGQLGAAKADELLKKLGDPDVVLERLGMVY